MPANPLLEGVVRGTETSAKEQSLGVLALRRADPGHGQGATPEMAAEPPQSGTQSSKPERTPQIKGLSTVPGGRERESGAEGSKAIGFAGKGVDVMWEQMPACT